MRAFVLPHPEARTPEFASVPTPAIDSDELLVRVRAIGVGIHDSTFLPPNAHYPYPIGIEAAGEVESVGASVTEYQPGDRIAFVSSMQPKGGTWAQFAAVSADSLILPIPATMEFTEAAAFPVAGNTALKALSVLNNVAAGSLFVAGGSGAIGTFAIQLAHSRGWRVAASASATNHGYLRSLGVEKAVDYRAIDWREQVIEWMPGGVDAVLSVQPSTSAASMPVVRDNGLLVSVSGDAIVEQRGVRMTGIPYQYDVRDELIQLMSDVAGGATHLELEHVYPFGEAGDALSKVQSRRARGKVVLQL